MAARRGLGPLLLTLLLFNLWACSSSAEPESIVLHTEHPLYEHFLELYGEYPPLLTAVGDINDDNDTDLIILYQESKGVNRMVAFWQQEGEVYHSDPSPSPVENYQIEWRDIDGKPPTEMVLSGAKGIHVGYAIYRWEEGVFYSLFGEGMEQCC